MGAARFEPQDSIFIHRMNNTVCHARANIKWNTWQEIREVPFSKFADRQGTNEVMLFLQFILYHYTNYLASVCLSFRNGVLLHKQLVTGANASQNFPWIITGRTRRNRHWHRVWSQEIPDTPGTSRLRWSSLDYLPGLQSARTFAPSVSVLLSPRAAWVVSQFKCCMNYGSIDRAHSALTSF
jgi:hypothetical protein